ncbi:MAG: hypothetical protein JWN52_6614 [Actinomycetia bacterium]|nr:hypothetical protein [Actinomycetes bacterium]
MTPEQFAEIKHRAGRTDPSQAIARIQRTRDIPDLIGEVERVQAVLTEVCTERNDLLAEVERLNSELSLAFSPGMYLDIQKVLDEALGTNEADGAAAGIVADVALLAEQKRTAEAEMDRLRTRVEALRVNRDQLKAKLTQADALIAELGRANGSLSALKVIAKHGEMSDATRREMLDALADDLAEGVTGR